MDPLSGAASAIAILQITGAIITTCYDYRSSVKNATKDAKQIIAELNDLRTVIEMLLALLDVESSARQAQVSVLEMLAEKNGPITRCQAEMEILKAKLEPKEGWLNIRSTIMWPLKEPDMRKAIQTIQNTKSTIQFALAVDQRKATSDIRLNVQSLRDDFSTISNNAQHDAMFRWLGRSDYLARHNAARRKCQKNTGQWVLENPQFQTWATSPNSLLWIHGIPGSGKTILCSTIIDELQHLREDPVNDALVYYYFDFNDNEKSTSEVLLRSLILQLASHKPEALASIEALYQKHQFDCSESSVKELLDAFSNIARQFRQVVVVVDALDECESREKLLQLLQDLNQQELKGLQFVVSSRPESDIKLELLSILTHEITLTEDNINEDILLYIQDSLKHDRKLSKWPSDIQEKIQSDLYQGSCGMFRWVFCQIDTLKRCLTTNDILKQLETLPRTLEATYEAILMRIDSDYRDRALKLLQWLAFSPRPTTVHEAIEMLAIDTEQEVYDANLRIVDEEDVLLLCPSLVTQGPTLNAANEQNSVMHKTDDSMLDRSRRSWIIQLAHFSVKDYLISNQARNGAASNFALDATLANVTMTEACLIYLLRPEFSAGYCDVNGRDSRIMQYPLYHYATYYWTFHLNLVEGHIHDRTWALLDRFFETRKMKRGGNFVAWVVSMNPRISLVGAMNSEPFYYAASFGILPLIKKLCQSGADIDQTGGRFYSTPLHAAIYRKNSEVAKFLLESKANPMATNSKNESCLYWAVINDDWETVDLLEHYGATFTEFDEEALKFIGIRPECQFD